MEDKDKMLILSRNINQKIILTVPGIGEIEISYLGNTSRYQSRIGVTAPDNVTIHREEIHKRIASETGKTIGKPSQRNNLISDFVNIAV
jgi:carbon storage regulator CsrA